MHRPLRRISRLGPSSASVISLKSGLAITRRRKFTVCVTRRSPPLVTFSKHLALLLRNTPKSSHNSTPRRRHSRVCVIPSPHRSSISVLWKTRSEEHTSELQSRGHLVCRLLLEKKKQTRP